MQCFSFDFVVKKQPLLKGVFAKNERGYRRKTNKKYYEILTIYECVEK